MNEIKNLDPLINSNCPKALGDSVEKANELFELKAFYYFVLFDLYGIDKDVSKSIFPEVYFGLIQSLEDGSSCLAINDEWFLNLLKQLKSTNDPEQLAEEFVKSIEAGSLKKIINFNNSNLCPIIMVKRIDKYYFYIEKVYQMECSLNNSLERISQSKSRINNIDMEFNEILNKNPLCFEDSTPYHINEEQLSSIKMVLKESFSIITGGPGTGKTFILFSLLRILIRNGYSIEDIALAAPTGKATNRMMESIQQNLQLLKTSNEIDNQLLKINCKTIHRLLGISQYRGEGKYHQNYHVPCKIIIIDEASMVDMSIMNTILNAIDSSKTKLLLIGDKDQLPSVELGAVLADLISTDKVNKVSTLVTSYRSKAALQKFVNLIKNYDGTFAFEIPMVDQTSVYLNSAAEGCSLLNLEDKTYHFLLEQLNDWIDHFYSSKSFDPQYKELNDEKIKSLMISMNHHQVLSVVNNGLYGVDKLNEYFIQEIITKYKLRKNKAYFHGMPIQILKNDYGLDLYNGDFGIIIERSNDEYEACFLKRGKIELIPVELLPAYQPGFVTTIHKSQGSEYDQLLLIIPPEKSLSILNKQLLYTGISRAKQKCLIIGSKNDFLNGLKNNFKRISGI